MSENVAWDATLKSRSNEINSEDTDPRNIARETLAAASASRRTMSHGIELSAKLGQSMRLQASKGLPSAEKIDLSQKGSGRFLKDLIRASNSYYWEAIMDIDTKNGIKSLLRNPRGVSMNEVKHGAEA